MRISDWSSDVCSSDLAYALASIGDTGEVDLHRFLGTIFRRKWLLLLTVLLGVTAAEWWIVSTTPRYRADAMIMIESRPSSIIIVDDAVPSLNNDLTATVNTEVAVLKSRNLVERVITKLDLADDKEFSPPVGKGEGWMAEGRSTSR